MLFDVVGSPGTWTRWTALVARWLVAAAVGSAVGVGCSPLGVGPALVWVRCDPSQDLHCANGFYCCSDDPAALGLEQEPLFSGVNNRRSRTGFCVHVADIEGTDLTLDEPAGCPLPCNPTWDDDRILEICGAGVSCCQTVELHEDDCIFDEALGQWRAAEGRDAEASLMGGASWTPTPDSTHQDPDFMACEAVAQGDRASEVFRACLGQLTTANQRGYCNRLGPGQVCPTEDASYTDACEAMH